MIAKEALKGNTPYYQQSRLTALVNAGVTVYVCQGSGSHGSFRKRAVVVDRRFLYTGSPNLTYQSDSGGNAELTFRMTGQPVLDVTTDLDYYMRTAVRKWQSAYALST